MNKERKIKQTDERIQMMNEDIMSQKLRDKELEKEFQEMFRNQPLKKETKNKK